MDKLETIRIAGNLIGLFYKDRHEYMTGQQLADLINKQSEELELANETLEVLRLGIEQQRQTVSQIHAKLDRLLPELKARLDKCSDEILNDPVNRYIVSGEEFDKEVQRRIADSCPEIFESSGRSGG